MKIVTLKFLDHQALYDKLNASPGNPVSATLHAAIHDEGVEWDMNMESAPLVSTGPAAVSVCAAAGLLGLKLEEVDRTADYRFCRTNAHESFDGFGTLTAETGAAPEEGKWFDHETRASAREPLRIVAIRREHWGWQTMRYSSGGNVYWRGIAG